jgi:hypothetical protein
LCLYTDLHISSDIDLREGHTTAPPTHRYLMGRLPLHGFTCDVMYCRQRRYLYYGGENLKYYLAPSPTVLPSRAALTTNSNGTQSAHKGKGWIDTIFMSMLPPPIIET